jgi:peptide/nickel transport system permease protein
VALIGQGTPSFLLAILAVLFLAVKLPLLPAGGFGEPADLVLPTVVLGWFICAGILRLLRSSMLEVLQTDYVLFARSLGMPDWRVVWLWALPNALMSVITFIGYMFGIIIAGAIVVEAVFVWPGLGRLAYEAVISRDLMLIQGTVLVLAVLMIGSNLLVDVAYLVLDPRVRHPRGVG